MLFADSLAREVAHLQRDASRVARDVGKLSDQLARLGQERATEAVRSVAGDARTRLASLGSGLREARRGTQAYTKRIDARLRNRPYRLAGAALCIGFALGALSRLDFQRD